MKINEIWFNADLSTIITELQSQLTANGIQLLQKTKETPTHIQVQCPYHADGQERRPSAGIRKEDGKFHCFACNEIHELPEVISHCFGHNDVLGKFGWNWLLKNFATVSVEERKDVKIDLARNNISNKTNRMDSVLGVSNMVYITEEELDKYRYTHPYVYERGLTDEIIELFDIGYDKDLGCITFPVRDVSGNCLFVARRAVKFKYYNYPSGAEKPLYGLYEYMKRYNSPTSRDELDNLYEVVVCEGMFDCLTCWVRGKYAVALNGTGSSLQMEQLQKLPARKLILATDNDEAGKKARERIRKNVSNKLISEYILPDNRKDINELTRNEFKNLLEIF